MRQGDLYRAALERPAIIGVIDGYFESVPTVWHKEILWAMQAGIHVYGAASSGALRAAELEIFGMRGIGRIYEDFRDGILEDDDEVAVLHGPEALSYPPVTEAMVNLRATFEAAATAGIIDAALGARLTDIAKGLFYKARSYEAVLQGRRRCRVFGRRAFPALDMAPGGPGGPEAGRRRGDARRDPRPSRRRHRAAARLLAHGRDRRMARRVLRKFRARRDP